MYMVELKLWIPMTQTNVVSYTDGNWFVIMSGMIWLYVVTIHKCSSKLSFIISPSVTDTVQSFHFAEDIVKLLPLNKSL